MRTKVITILTTFFTTICFGQTSNLFVINETFVKNIFSRKTADSFTKSNNHFFEDEFYSCSKTCHGEFGGTIIFKSKKSGIEFLTEATCPVIINKLNGKYIVTTTLAHMRGFSEIFEITYPDSLSGKEESRVVKKLIDTLGVLTLTSFVYEDQLYHIVTDFKKTLVAKIENSKFVYIATLSNESIWTYDPEPILTSDNHCIVFFSNKEAKGYIDIYENKISLTRYR